MKLERLFSGAGLLILPFYISISQIQDQMRWPKTQFFILLAGLYVAALLWKQINRPLGGALAIFLLSGHFSRTGYAIEQVLALIAAGISCFWVRSPRENEVKVALKLLEFTGTLCAVYALVQWSGRDPILSYYEFADKVRPPVLFGQHTLYGPFAAAAFASALFSRRYPLAAFLFIPIIAINSSFTFLSAGVVIFVFAIHRFHLKALLLIPMVLAAFLGLQAYKKGVADELVDNNGRFVLWRIVSRIAVVHPVGGHGLGSFQVVFPLFQSEERRREMGLVDSELSSESRALLREAELLRIRSGSFLTAHNEYLQVFFEQGIPGVIAIIALIFSFFAHFLRLKGSREEWALCAIFCLFLANAIGSFPFHLIPQSLLPLWSFVAVTTKNRGGILES